MGRNLPTSCLCCSSTQSQGTVWLFSGGLSSDKPSLIDLCQASAILEDLQRKLTPVLLKAAADARAAAAAAKAAAARPSQLELPEQACVQACRNLAGQCRNPFV